MLKDKYAKFTPLVFLTNFVFAYQKFQRRLEEEQVQQRHRDHTALVDEVTAVVQAKIGNLTFLEVEREKQEVEMRQFLDKYEAKSLGWRQALDDRDKEVERLKKQLEGKSISSGQTNSSNSQSQQEEEHAKLRQVRMNCRYILYRS